LAPTVIVCFVYLLTRRADALMCLSNDVKIMPASM
jgi:hypothetical protein